MGNPTLKTDGLIFLAFVPVTHRLKCFHLLLFLQISYPFIQKNTKTLRNNGRKAINQKKDKN